MILECPRCWRQKEGNFSEKNPPGECVCKTFQPWRVVKQRRPLFPQGHVRLLTDKGWQNLHAPYYRER